MNGGWNGVTIQMKSVCTINFLLTVLKVAWRSVTHYDPGLETNTLG